jgi:hypothetical protein
MLLVQGTELKRVWFERRCSLPSSTGSRKRNPANLEGRINRAETDMVHTDVHITKISDEFILGLDAMHAHDASMYSNHCVP